jgi:hypothetical protein
VSPRRRKSLRRSSEVRCCRHDVREPDPARHRVQSDRRWLRRRLAAVLDRACRRQERLRLSRAVAELHRLHAQHVAVERQPDRQQRHRAVRHLAGAGRHAVEHVRRGARSRRFAAGGDGDRPRGRCRLVLQPADPDRPRAERAGQRPDVLRSCAERYGQELAAALQGRVEVARTAAFRQKYGKSHNLRNAMASASQCCRTTNTTPNRRTS